MIIVDQSIKKNRTGYRSLFSSMIACSFFAHLSLFYLMAIAYSESVERVESPQIKAIKGYLISKEDFLPKEVKELRNRTTLPAPEHVPSAPAQVPLAAPVKLPQEVKKEAESKALLTKPKPDDKKEKEKEKEREKELKKKALEEINKKLSQPKALPIITPSIPNRPTPRPENFPLPEGWKESKKATVEIPLPEGSQSGQTGSEAENEIELAVSKYSALVQTKILNNFFVSNKKVLKDNPSGKIVVEMNFDLAGNYSSSRIVIGSDSVVDDNCTNAIERARPFPEMPEIVKAEVKSFNIEFKFSDLVKYVREE